MTAARNIIRKLASPKGFLILMLLNIASLLFCTLSELPQDSGVSAVLWPEYETVLSRFDAADRRMIAVATDELNRYFDKMEDNIEPFLDDLYSFTAKGKMLWYLLKDIKLKEIEGVSPYVMMLPPMIPVREGSSLPDFLGRKFNHYFGSSSEVKSELRNIVDGIDTNLSYNNERLAVELGALAAVTRGNSEDSAVSAAAGGGFKDRAKDLSVMIVARTSGLQTGIEIAALASDCYVAPYISAYIVSVMAAEGMIVVEGVAGGMVTFGVAAAIAIATDIVANNISKSSLRPKIRQALQQRRNEVVADFKKSIVNNLRKFHRSRRGLIRKTLSRE